MSDTLLTSFLSATFTKADLYHRLSLLREFFEFVFYSQPSLDFKTGLKDFMAKQNLTEEDQKILASLPNEFFSSFNQKNLYQNLETLKKQANELSTLTIYLTVDLEEPYRAVIGSWVRKNISDQVLIDLKTDPQISAGCRLVWKGIFRDYSFRSYLKQKGEIISQVLSSYEQKQN